LGADVDRRLLLLEILFDDDKAGCADVDTEKRRVDGLNRGRAIRARHCLHAEVDDKEAIFQRMFSQKCFCSFLFPSTFRPLNDAAIQTREARALFPCLGPAPML